MYLLNRSFVICEPLMEETTVTVLGAAGSSWAWDRRHGEIGYEEKKPDSCEQPDTAESELQG